MAYEKHYLKFNSIISMSIILYIVLDLVSSYAKVAESTTVKFNWNIEYANVTRLCNTKSLVSVNGQFPGPTAVVREGDDVVVKVTNLVSDNVTIHWHGVRQLRTAWADGPAYITQCPIQTGHSYIYRFRVTQQRGTLLWHAHFSWLRATLYGAFIILPCSRHQPPYPPPAGEHIILLGEWWKADVESIIAAALRSGGAYNLSDALTINGQPGAFYDCSVNDTHVVNVVQGRTYLIRIINAAMNFHLYVGVANHNVTVVEVDAAYTEPYTTDILVLSPGQTTNVLLTANQAIDQYFLSASVFSPPNSAIVPFPMISPTAIIRYSGASATPNASLAMPNFPYYNDSNYVLNYLQRLRGNVSANGVPVPQTVDEDLFFTVGYALQVCANCTFAAFPGLRLSTAINNVTFADPALSLLQAYYYNVSGVYEANFPSLPEFVYNYTSPSSSLGIISNLATKVKVLDYGAQVQLVLQNTGILFFENHPIHLHGFNFHVVGLGFGNFNATNDTPNFNLVNPPFFNTIGVPSGGWVAIRFTADNPGVWYMHCHFDFHTSIGMSMAFIVKNGQGKNETLTSPPFDLPSC